jgi:predicted HNH restriction endonuclease
VFSRKDWDAYRIPVCTSAGDVCEVCGAQVYTDSGRKRRPDCHELWIFEHRGDRSVQRLDRLIALCPDCHRAQHIGLAGVNDEIELVIARLRDVNGWTAAQAMLEINRTWA